MNAASNAPTTYTKACGTVMIETAPHQYVNLSTARALGLLESKAEAPVGRVSNRRRRGLVRSFVPVFDQSNLADRLQA